MVADASTNRMQQLSKAFEKFACIQELKAAFQSTFTILREQIAVSSGNVYLLNEDHNLELHSFFPQKKPSPPPFLDLGEGVPGKIAQKKSVKLFVDREKDLHVLSLPLFREQKIYGVLTLSGEIDQVSFIPEEIEFTKLISQLLMSTVQRVEVQQKLEDFDKNLEGKILERTGAISDLLDTSGQGFLSFGSDYLIHKEYSHACVGFFGEELAEKSVFQFLFNHSEEETEETKELFEMLFDGTSDLWLVAPMLPEELNANDHILTIEYNHLSSEDGANSKIMLTLTDMTAERQMEEQLKKDEEKNTTIIKVSLDKEGFLEFLRELDQLFKAIYFALEKPLEEINIDELYRYYHTVKGGAGIYALQQIVDKAHSIESTLPDYRAKQVEINQAFIEQLRKDSQELEDILNEILEDLRSIIPEEERNQTDRAFRIPKSKLVSCQNLLIEELGLDHKEAIKASFNQLSKQPIGPVFRQFSTTIQGLAEQLRKKVKVELVGIETEVSFDKYSELFNVLIHLLRNSVDHGLEFADIRVQSGKTEYGRIKVVAQDSKKELKITISDDGKGIDPQQIKERVLNANLIFPEEADNFSGEELIQLIFLPGFSTKEIVTDISGRGVGLDAVKALVRKLGGDIVVKSRLNYGTSFEIKLPHVDEE